MGPAERDWNFESLRRARELREGKWDMDGNAPWAACFFGADCYRAVISLCILLADLRARGAVVVGRAGGREEVNLLTGYVSTLPGVLRCAEVVASRYESYRRAGLVFLRSGSRAASDGFGLPPRGMRGLRD